MLYVSGAKENHLGYTKYGVCDTEDGIVEWYSKKQLRYIVSRGSSE